MNCVIKDCGHNRQAGPFCHLHAAQFIRMMPEKREVVKVFIAMKQPIDDQMGPPGGWLPSGQDDQGNLRINLSKVKIR